MIKNISIDKINYKIAYITEFENLIILRDTVILECLLNNEDSKNRIQNYFLELSRYLLNNKLDLSYGYGYSSLMFMCEFINDNYIKDIYTKMNMFVKNQLLKIMYKPMPLIIDCKFNSLFDYFRGLSGIFSYYIYFTNDCVLKKEISNYLIKCIKITSFTSKHTNITIAHGLSSIVLLLAELTEKNYISNKDKIDINKLYNFIFHILKENCQTKKTLSVAWGNGELGVFYALCKFYSVSKLKISVYEYQQILSEILRKTHLNSINKANICYGGMGTKIMLEKIEEMETAFSNCIQAFYKKIEFPKMNIGSSCMVIEVNVKDYSIINACLAEHLFMCRKHKIDNKYYKYFML